MANDCRTQVTQILEQAEAGDPNATEQLLPLVYDELRRIAQSHMNDQSSGHTLQATALVHEAYLKLIASAVPLRWESRGHFFAVAAEAMRCILIDHARAKLTQKRGGERKQVAFPDIVLSNEIPPATLIEFNEVLESFCERHPQHGQLVKLRCFAGLGRDELSKALSISLATVDRYWQFAKVKIYCDLTDGFSLPEHGDEKD